MASGGNRRGVSSKTSARARLAPERVAKGAGTVWPNPTARGADTVTLTRLIDNFALGLFFSESIPAKLFFLSNDVLHVIGQRLELRERPIRDRVLKLVVGDIGAGLFDSDLVDAAVAHDPRDQAVFPSKLSILLLLMLFGRFARSLRTSNSSKVFLICSLPYVLSCSGPVGGIEQGFVAPVGGIEQGFVAPVGGIEQGFVAPVGGIETLEESVNLTGKGVIKARLNGAVPGGWRAPLATFPQATEVHSRTEKSGACSAAWFV